MQQVEDIDEKSIRIEPCKISWIEGDTTFKYISYGYPAFACSIDLAKAGSWTVDQQNGRLIAASPSIVSYGYDNHNNVFIEDDSTPYQRLNLISTNERLLSELARALEQLASYCDHEKDSAHEP
ncbi:MAG TPA: hypothetical protein VKY32_07795 [Flavobacterium sp.]|nr:hypothetical protein [Flavobacterium sp.]